jgi:hypothetical protein
MGNIEEAMEEIRISSAKCSEKCQKIIEDTHILELNSLLGKEILINIKNNFNHTDKLQSFKK